jgi:hypothetical protein
MARGRKLMQSGPGTTRKAPAEEPFILVAMLSLLGATVWMALRPELLLQFFYSTEQLALVHLLTLGFLTALIMGVLLRLAPQALGVAPCSRRLALVQAACFLVGAAGMVTHFALGEWAGIASATPLVLLAALLQCVNFRGVFGRAARGELPALHVAAALVHLVLVASLGLAYGFLHAWGVGFGTADTPLLARLGAHVLLAAGGWVAGMVLGLQLVLLPSTAARRSLPRLRLVLYQGGLLGGATCLLAHLPGLPWMLGALALAVALQLLGPLPELGRQRGALGEVLALLLLLAAACAACASALDLPADPDLRLRLLHATGYALLVGFGPLTLASTGARLFPQWVWDERFGGEAGLRSVPPVSALASTRLRDLAVATLLAGVATTSAGILLEHELAVRAGTWTVVGGAVLLVAGFARTASWELLHREWRGDDR